MKLVVALNTESSKILPWKEITHSPLLSTAIELNEQNYSSKIRQIKAVSQEAHNRTKNNNRCISLDVIEIPKNSA
jgi:hypothetical protein